MNAVDQGNYVNNSLLIGMSDLIAARSQRPLVITKGRGVYVTDEDGREYLEAVAAYSCAALGFHDEELIEAAVKQLRDLPMALTGYNRTHPVALELAEKLAKLMPIKDARIGFATTGSEANDNLVKLMWYGNIEAGEPQRRKVISRWGSYHGHTIFTAGLGRDPLHHRQFGLPMEDHIHVSQPAGAGPDESEQDYVRRLAEEVRNAILKAGPETVAAFIAEPVSFSADISIPPATYFTAIQEVLDEFGVKMINDEVLTGFGRTGELFGAERFNIKPYAMTLSKGLSSAYQPIGAYAIPPEFYERIERASVAGGWFPHAATFHAHPVSTAVALKSLEIWEKRDISGHVKKVSPVFETALNSLHDHPLVTSTHAVGLMGGIRLRTSKPREGLGGLAAGGIAKEVYDACFQCGLIVRTGTDMIKITPPVIISESEISELVERFRRALDLVLATKKESDLAVGNS